MTNRFNTAVQHLRNRLGQTVGVSLVYTGKRNGSTFEISLTGWQGRTAFRMEENGSSRVHWSDRDFLIPVSELLLDSERVEPNRGDRIVERQQEGNVRTERTYEVFAPDNEQEFRYSDVGNTIYRIHTKEIV